MTTNYPGSLDNATTLPSSYTDSTPTDVEHAAKHNNISDAIIAMETELGILPKGSFASVATRLASLISKTPSTSQNIILTADVVALILKGFAGQTANMLEIKSSADTLLGYIDKDGDLSAAGYQIGGATLASTHLSDSAALAKNPSPSIVTPTISSPAMSGTAIAPTPSAADDSTKVATTEHVIDQGLAKLAGPTLTGTPTAPTAALDTNTTQIATTAFIVAQIADTPIPQPPTGMILAYAGTSPPSGWLLCDGSAVSRATYATLFGITSTSYGAGDGTTTFNLPDLQGRLAVGKGTHVDVDTLGESDGVAVGSRRPKHSHSHTIAIVSAGTHTHGGGGTGSGGDHSHSNASIGGSVGAVSGGTTAGQTNNHTTSSAGGHSHGSIQSGSDGSHTHSLSGTIGTGSLTDTPGYLVLNYIIKT